MISDQDTLDAIAYGLQLQSGVAIAPGIEEISRRLGLDTPRPGWPISVYHPGFVAKVNAMAQERSALVRAIHALRTSDTAGHLADVQSCFPKGYFVVVTEMALEVAGPDISFPEGPLPEAFRYVDRVYSYNEEGLLTLRKDRYGLPPPEGLYLHERFPVAPVMVRKTFWDYLY